MFPTTPREEIFWSETSSHLLVSELNFMVEGQINERHSWSFSEQIISSSSNKPSNKTDILKHFKIDETDLLPFCDCISAMTL